MRSSLLFGVLFILFTDIAAHNKHRLIACLPEDTLLKRVNQLLQRSARQTEVMPVEAAAAQSCSDFSRLQFSAELRNRSLSPWRSVLHRNPDMYPEQYEAAECLCSGCIIKGEENKDYNSVPVMKSMMFLKKVKCPTDSSKYSLEIEYKTIPVSCTCVVPRQ